MLQMLTIKVVAYIVSTWLFVDQVKSLSSEMFDSCQQPFFNKETTLSGSIIFAQKQRRIFFMVYARLGGLKGTIPFLSFIPT